MTGQGFRETGFETRLRFLRVRANQTLGGGGTQGPFQRANGSRPREIKLIDF